jgi:hypothetical protein
VDATGKVTVPASATVGEAIITVTTVDGGKTATCNVTVSPIAVTGVTLNKTTTTIAVGGTETLIATVAPATATNKNVTWSSNNTARATVDATGKVTVPVSATSGTVNITVRTEDGGRTATCTVTVSLFDGDGTPGNPYIIRTPAQLDAVRENLSAHYRLGNNIELTNYLRSGGAGYAKWGTQGWGPIGGSFIGSFDGAGFIITGLWINYPAGYFRNSGLFDIVSGGSVKNLGLELADAGIRGSGASSIGGIAASVWNGGSITNCYVTGDVRSNGGSTFNSVGVGGIAGDVGSNCSVINCYVTGSIYGNYGGGGIVGNIGVTGRITNCVALNPSVANGNIGRIVGADFILQSGTFVHGAGILSNNWARSNMEIAKTLVKGNNTVDGADCAAIPAANWWTTTAPNGPGWSSSIWTFSTGQLPKLRPQ